jgi:MFS transporter, SP family, general alpha glucoside:H+ symporter
MPQFQETFGTLQEDGSYELSATWQTGLSNGTQCGQIIGLIINGWVSERFGYRYTSIGCLTLIAAFVSLLFTATTPQQLLAGNILCGVVSDTTLHPHLTD